MWWCCGKTTKEADGCKIAKHESKDDDEDEAADPDAKEEQQKHLKNVRCFCCKEVGHTIDQCPRDPNLKTTKDAIEEMDRVKQIKDYRKLFSDTMILTTHFLKRCTKVPKVKKPQLESADGANTTLISGQTPGQTNQAPGASPGEAGAGAAAGQPTQPVVPEIYVNPEIQQAVNKYAPFKRGVMRFEDYNYRMYNQYILID